LLQNLKKKNNSFNIEKLKYELKKYLDKFEQNTFVAEIKKSVVLLPKSAPGEALDQEKKHSILFHQLPESMRPILLGSKSIV
jgi:hypothetical protein